MLDSNPFHVKAIQLSNTLIPLWLLMHQALTLGVTPERTNAIQRVLSEVNRLHAEMFPDFESSLYADDFLSMIEDE